MGINYLEEKEKADRIALLLNSLEWHIRSMKYTFIKLIPTEDFDAAAERLEKAVNDFSELDKELTEKAGWK